ncbi:centromere protein X-like isoform X1 [Mercenaria mercenaria]|uniref:centromere protein X-like isoform X1 n=1 Tax=Mercenaria mercenaria TaxID=6596 RepID=UPI00234EB733|nr:centromere protein X-like isoform X1 [Mercenaria mercenaria]
MAERFKQKTVQQILQQYFKDDKTKMTAESLALVTEVATVFVAEAVGRTVRQAKKDGDNELSLEHFEKILPQLLLDL